MRRLFLVATAAAAAAAAASGARASETITYSYNELGRLVQAASTGTINNGVTLSTSYDPAGNRTNYSVTGSSGIAALHDPASSVAWAWHLQAPRHGGAIVLDPRDRPHGTAFLRSLAEPGDALLPWLGAGAGGEPAAPAASPF